MFRGFREIRREVEKNLDDNRKINEFMLIKPETTMTVDEAKDFMNELFAGLPIEED